MIITNLEPTLKNHVKGVFCLLETLHNESPEPKQCFPHFCLAIQQEEDNRKTIEQLYVYLHKLETVSVNTCLDTSLETSVPNWKWFSSDFLNEIHQSRDEKLTLSEAASHCCKHGYINLLHWVAQKMPGDQIRYNFSSMFKNAFVYGQLPILDFLKYKTGVPIEWFGITENYYIVKDAIKNNKRLKETLEWLAEYYFPLMKITYKRGEFYRAFHHLMIELVEENQYEALRYLMEKQNCSFDNEQELVRMAQAAFQNKNEQMLRYLCAIIRQNIFEFKANTFLYLKHTFSSFNAKFIEYMWTQHYEHAPTLPDEKNPAVQIFDKFVFPPIPVLSSILSKISIEHYQWNRLAEQAVKQNRQDILMYLFTTYKKVYLHHNNTICYFLKLTLQHQMFDAVSLLWNNRIFKDKIDVGVHIFHRYFLEAIQKNDESMITFLQTLDAKKTPPLAIQTAIKYKRHEIALKIWDAYPKPAHYVFHPNIHWTEKYTFSWPQFDRENIQSCNELFLHDDPAYDEHILFYSIDPCDAASNIGWVVSRSMPHYLECYFNSTSPYEPDPETKMTKIKRDFYDYVYDWAEEDPCLRRG